MRDKYFNPTTCESSDFEISAVSSDAVKAFVAITNSSVTSEPYFAFFVTRSGSYSLKVLHKSSSLLGCPLAVSVVPSALNLSVSSARGFASVGAILGGGSVCGEFMASDSYGNIIPAGSLSMSASVVPVNLAELSSSFFSSFGSLAFCYSPKAVGNVTLSFMSAIGLSKQYNVSISSSSATFCSTLSYITSPSQSVVTAGAIVTFTMLASDTFGFRASSYPSTCVLKEANFKISDTVVSDQGGSSLSAGLYLTVSSSYSFAIFCSTHQLGGSFNVTIIVVPAPVY
jgi:hypothetical protein